MGKFLKENYYILVRMLLMLVYGMYGLSGNVESAGVPLRILLLLALFISAMMMKELAEGKWKPVFLTGALLLNIALFVIGGSSFMPLACFTGFEIISFFKGRVPLYFLMYLAVLVDSPLGNITEFMIVTMLIVFYVQHEYVVAGYEKRMYEDTVLQQGLKREYQDREYEVQAELKRNMLEAENQVLSERAALSQTLHDKLGHNINGSIYQLEAVKLLIDKDPEKAGGMVQSVIDQLRGGMDEIRAILRKERPEKKKMALLQLYELCADCNKKGVEAELNTDGNLSAIPDTLWEVILDNTFEAVTNSMKYSRCKRIDISILVMNEMLRCTVSDDGVGCESVKDGMGISGMRQRIRNAGGTINFETEAGFCVNMLLPMQNAQA
ncbi:MAG: hypothetical protein IKR23_02980 [Lachnospiraceae bacterium]|nr:hypothetical protein [Lachnospiraceae bacterium]